DPVRVFQRYSTLNAISGGRAEVILGRGSSIESFPLFGYDLADYEELFEEKATLFSELVKGGPVTWAGKARAPLLGQDVVPHIEDGPLPVWIGVGGNPQSVIRAPPLGLSLALPAPPPRVSAGRGHLRRPAGPVRPVLAVVPGRPGAVRPPAAAGDGALAGPRRGHRRAGESGVLAAVAGHHHAHRARARLRDSDRE